MFSENLITLLRFTYKFAEEIHGPEIEAMATTMYGIYCWIHNMTHISSHIMIANSFCNGPCS